MACYHPLAAFPNYGERAKSGGYRYKVTCAYNPEFEKLDPNVVKVPCGRCVGCRLDYSRKWADRMLLELEDNDGKGLFITLTYNNENVPKIFACDCNGEVMDDCPPFAYTLCKRDLQLFMKRLRRHFEPLKIRFYAAGEYGPKTRRPHYHLILFGLSLDDFPDRVIVGRNELGQDYFSSPTFADLWGNGFVTMSTVSYKTCAYVSRYTLKKSFSFLEPDLCESEFVLMSRRPGIGAGWFDKHPDYTPKIFLSDGSESKEISFPSFFLRKLKESNPSLFEEISTVRVRSARDSELLKLQSTSLSYIDKLELDEARKIEKVSVLVEGCDKV